MEKKLKEILSRPITIVILLGILILVIGNYVIYDVELEQFKERCCEDKECEKNIGWNTQKLLCVNLSCYEDIKKQYTKDILDLNKPIYPIQYLLEDCFYKPKEIDLKQLERLE